MILDSSFDFSVDQAVTTTAVSENVVDLGAAFGVTNADFSLSMAPLYLVVAIGDSFTGPGAATFTVEVQTDDNSGFASPTTVASFTYVLDEIAEPGLLIIAAPRRVGRYVRLNYVVASGPFTAGSVDASMTLNPPEWNALPTAIPRI